MHRNTVNSESVVRSKNLLLVFEEMETQISELRQKNHCLEQTIANRDEKVEQVKLEKSTEIKQLQDLFLKEKDNQKKY